MSQNSPTPKTRYASLFFFCVATVFMIPFEMYPFGGVFWIASFYYAMADSEAFFRRRMAVLLGCVSLLTAAPIHTDTSNEHILQLGGFFLAVIALPPLILWKWDREVFSYQFWPKRFRWLDLLYVAISIPLAKYIFDWYFGYNDYMPTQWFLPENYDVGSTHRLFWGINGVGIWDELFFVNTVYVLLRSMFSFRVANLAQAVVYTAVLFDMAFIGIGPVLVYLFALTQGAMFEESENLLYVLIVHLIVDYFLFSSIVAHYYPGDSVAGLLFH
jgi:hypothetical protein